MSLTVNGTVGNDTITVSGLAVTVNGAGLATTSSTFIILADAGDDAVGLFAGESATVDGGAGDDTIGSRFDIASILGGSGDDHIGVLGTGTTTTVDAGSGDDMVTAFLVGGSASIEGGSGHDRIAMTGTGVATVSGGSGDDLIFGGAGGDLLLGGNGKDNVFGDFGDDTIDGGNGKDTLEGGPGSDLVEGGNGKDLLIGGASGGTGTGTGDTDTFTGGHGKDTFVFKFEVTVENSALSSSTDNLIITDAQKKETLVFDSGGDPDVDSLVELDALVNVTDDGTDVFVEFPHGGGSVVITLEGLGESSAVIDSLEDLGKVLKLEFA